MKPAYVGGAESSYSDGVVEPKHRTHARTHLRECDNELVVSSARHLEQKLRVVRPPAQTPDTITNIVDTRSPTARHHTVTAYVAWLVQPPAVAPVQPLLIRTTGRVVSCVVRVTNTM
jgi:hypothetical protein